MPFCFFLSYAELGSAAGDCSICVSFEVPPGSTILNPLDNYGAYKDLPSVGGFCAGRLRGTGTSHLAITH